MILKRGNSTGTLRIHEELQISPMPPKTKPAPVAEKEPIGLPWFLEHLRRERAVVKGAPFSFAVVTLIVSSLLCAGAYWFSEKLNDSELRGKNATIERLSKQIEAEQKDNERLRQSRPAPDASLSLRAEAMNLAKQLDATSENWKPEQTMGGDSETQHRFGLWLEDIVKRLDRHGQWSEQLKQQAENFYAWNKDEIAKASKEIRRLAENLKE